MQTITARDLPIQSLRSVAASRAGNTIIVDDADQDRTIRVTFPRPARIPELDAARRLLVLRTYLESGAHALRHRFANASVQVA